MFFEIQTRLFAVILCVNDNIIFKKITVKQNAISDICKKQETAYILYAVSGFAYFVSGFFLRRYLSTFSTMLSGIFLSIGKYTEFKITFEKSSMKRAVLAMLSGST